jgi:hypothetical protein
MEAPGKPKPGAQGKPLGLRRLGSADSPTWEGAYAVLDPEREAAAEEKRAIIASLDSKLQACRSDLYRIYETPLKYEATIKLTATRTVTVKAGTLADAKDLAQEAAETSYEDFAEEDWNVEEVEVEDVKLRSS